MKKNKYNLRAQASLGVFALMLSGFLVSGVQTGYATEIKKVETRLYRDFFDQNIYREFTSYFHFENFYRKVMGPKSRSRNVNVYDEVPDSTFFINRHAKQPLSLKDLELGRNETSGPDASSKMTVTSGKFEGLHPGFFVSTENGEDYLLKFDDIDNFEMQTSAEVIASRFYHAIGYNVPQYTIVAFGSEALVPGEGALIRDDSGFKKPLTQEKLDEYLLFLPQDGNGRYRASASKILSGKHKGNFMFYGKRKDDPKDNYNHENRREIRALAVFASWLNNYDVRESNTLDMLETVDGEPTLVHYLIDFNAAFGGGSLYPMFSREHMIDYGESLKAFLSFGLWEKPWQKQWKEIAKEGQFSPAVGHFESKHFKPEEHKVQFPHYAFKFITRADGFWAAKIIMSFTDEQIRTMVSSGKLSDPKDEEYVAKTLSERRDKVGRYWFDLAAPLDGFDLKGSHLVFEDLVKKYGLSQNSRIYQVNVSGRSGRRTKKIDRLELHDETLDLGSWLSSYDELIIKLRAQKLQDDGLTPPVRVTLNANGITSISHAD